MASDCKVHRLIADVAVFAGDRVLLVKYEDVTRYDGQRGWFLPDDFLAYAEHPEVAATRIAMEQTGISLPNVRLDHIESFGDGAWHITFHFRANLRKAVPLAAGPNVAAAEWFPRSRLPGRATVAHHGWALDVIEKMTRSPVGSHGISAARAAAPRPPPR